MANNTKVVQLSSVHATFDTRIFYKICTSLVKAGYEVDLIIQHTKDEQIDGINIKSLPVAKRKLDRPLKIIPRLLFKAIKYPKGTIFHFHDPELIPVGFILKLLGHKVIYDVHEDTVTDIRQKLYIPKFFREFFVWGVKVLESLAKKFFSIIIAEIYYEERFPDAVKVLNYPILDWAEQIQIERANPQKLLYTGNITEDRGALIHSELIGSFNQDELSEFVLIGHCPAELYENMVSKAGENKSKLLVKGVNKFIKFKSIINQYTKQDWIAGLALFPKTPHYELKRLTKFYEYMAAGLPIIYSNFEGWKSFLEPLNVGIAVDPDNLQEIRDAISLLKDNSELRLTMANNGRKYIESGFSWKNEEKKLLDLYSKISN